MKEGPDIATIGSLIGDPGRANMLIALMSGKALTATELATEANITVQTASSHLAKLAAGGLLAMRKQGRHRYFSLDSAEVGAVLESLMGLAASKGHMRVRTGPRDGALRKARVCYNHLAGEYGVQMLDHLLKRELIKESGQELELTIEGRKFFDGLGFDIGGLSASRRPMCKSCLDWSARRSHLAGALGTALLDYFYDNGWAEREEGTRVVLFSKPGELKFKQLFDVPPV